MPGHVNLPCSAVQKPVPNQAPTPAGFARPRTTFSDTPSAPTCGIQTRADAIRRNRRAWPVHGPQKVSDTLGFGVRRS
jgi:hypothetical protein